MDASAAVALTPPLHALSSHVTPQNALELRGHLLWKAEVQTSILLRGQEFLIAANVVEWLTVNERSLVVDSIVLGQVYVGVLALPRGRKRSNLERWFDSLVQTIDCFAWDAAIARRWASVGT